MTEPQNLTARLNEVEALITAQTVVLSGGLSTANGHLAAIRDLLAPAGYPDGALLPLVQGLVDTTNLLSVVSLLRYLLKNSADADRQFNLGSLSSAIGLIRGATGAQSNLRDVVTAIGDQGAQLAQLQASNSISATISTRLATMASSIDVIAQQLAALSQSIGLSGNNEGSTLRLAIEAVQQCICELRDLADDSGFGQEQPDGEPGWGGGEEPPDPTTPCEGYTDLLFQVAQPDWIYATSYVEPRPHDVWYAFLSLSTFGATKLNPEVVPVENIVLGVDPGSFPLAFTLDGQFTGQLCFKPQQELTPGFSYTLRIVGFQEPIEGTVFNGVDFVACLASGLVQGGQSYFCDFAESDAGRLYGYALTIEVPPGGAPPSVYAWYRP
jgi:hypothetical protein